MRYIKVLVLAIFIFLALIFFFQNQAPLSQQMELSLNLFFIPPMTSIQLPFYFIVIAAFFVGCLLTLFWLVWDKFITSSKLMKTRWNESRLEREVADLKKQLEIANSRLAKESEEARSETGQRALPASSTESSVDHDSAKN